jgi:hypothetical protein
MQLSRERGKEIISLKSYGGIRSLSRRMRDFHERDRKGQFSADHIKRIGRKDM